MYSIIQTDTGNFVLRNEADGTDVLTLDSSGNITLNDTTLTYTNLDLGSSGTAGSLDIFPSTASKGKLAFVAANNTNNDTTTITQAAQGGAYTYTIPDAGASASFVMTAGNQTIGGTKTIAALVTTNLDAGASGTAGSIDIFPTTASKGKIAITATANTNDDTLTITNAAQAAARTYTIPDAGTNASFLMTQGAQTIVGAATFTAAITPTGGIAASGGFAVSPRNIHTGAAPAQVSTDGTDATPDNTETYIAEVFVPANATITGVAVMNGSVASGNIKVGLANSSGAVVASSASTAMSGTDAYQRVDFSAPYAAVGPATYYVLQQVDNNTARINTHTFGNFGASKKTGETYDTFTTITPPTTFTTALGPIASLY